MKGNHLYLHRPCTVLEDLKEIFYGKKKREAGLAWLHFNFAPPCVTYFWTQQLKIKST